MSDHPSYAGAAGASGFLKPDEQAVVSLDGKVVVPGHHQDLDATLRKVADLVVLLSTLPASSHRLDRRRSGKGGVSCRRATGICAHGGLASYQADVHHDNADRLTARRVGSSGLEKTGLLDGDCEQRDGGDRR